MAVTMQQVYERLNEWAPFATQMDFDNAGLLVGRRNRTVTRILTTLDITREVILEASQQGCQLIVSHHPVIFHPVKSVTDGDPVGRSCCFWRSRASGPSVPTPTWTPPRGA